MTEISGDFFCRGMQLYPDALRTIRYFEESVQAISAEVFERHLDEFTRALGVEPPKMEPYTAVWKGDRTWVAAVVNCLPPLWKIFVGVFWKITTAGSDQAFAAVELGCQTIQFKEQLQNRLRSTKLSARYEIQGGRYDVWTQAELRPDNALDLRSLLDEQLLEWTARLHEIGGIRALEAG
jgi:hypothetical protein